MKEYKLSIKVGDLVEVGRFRNVQTKIAEKKQWKAWQGAYKGSGRSGW